MAIVAPATMLIAREYILQAIEEDLNTIDGTGSYHFNVGTVTRKFTPFNEIGASNCPALIVTDGNDVILVEPEGGYNLQREMTAIVWGYVYQSDEVHTNRDLNYLLEDVIRCLKVNKQRGTRNDGSKLAMWTRFGRIETDEGYLTPYGVFRLEVRVSYFYLDTDT